MIYLYAMPVEEKKMCTVGNDLKIDANCCQHVRKSATSAKWKTAVVVVDVGYVLCRKSFF